MYKPAKGNVQIVTGDFGEIMKIKINKWIEIESSNGNAVNLTYEEAKELYVKLQSEFGELSESCISYPPGVRVDTTFKAGTTPTPSVGPMQEYYNLQYPRGN